MPGRGIGVSPLVRSGTTLNHTAEYKTVLAAMPTKPIIADQINQNAIVAGLKDWGVWDLCEVADIFMAHSSDSAAINWKNPGTHNPIPINMPLFEAYGGFTGVAIGSKYVRLNYNPAQNASIITKDNMTIIIGIGTDLQDGGNDFGAYDGTTQLKLYTGTGGNMAIWLNASGSVNVANASSKGHYGFARKEATTTYRNKNTTEGVQAQNSTASLINKELYTCGYNNNNTVQISTKQIRYVLICGYLTQYQIDGAIGVMETYCKKYDKGLITDPIMVANPLTNESANLTTFVGFENETIHPSVIKTTTPIGGYGYWMANTPFPKKHYPATHLDYEIPCIWASPDGKSWVVPEGLTNPIQPVVPGEFSPDTDIYEDNNALYCFFQQKSGGATGYFKFLKSVDGINWTDKTQLVTPEQGVSPSIIKIGAYYYIYYVINTGVFETRRMRSLTIDGEYTNVENITLNGMGVYTAWHIDIIEINSIYWMVILANDYTYIYAAHSTDGLTFTVSNSKAILFNQKMTGISSFYRPSLMRLSSGKLLMYLPEIQASNGTYVTSCIECLIV